MLPLFRGRAYFGPSVPAVIQAAWVAHGGTLSSKEDRRQRIDYYFCYGRTDSVYARLFRSAIPVFHAQWVVNVVTVKFPLPIAPYVLNSVDHSHPPRAPLRHHLRRVQDDLQTQTAEHPRKKLRPQELEKKRQSTSFDGDSSGLTLVDDDLSVRKSPEIPFIDFTKIKTSGRKSGEVLRITKVPRNTGIRGSGVRPYTLSFNLGAGSLPRLSGADARKALRTVQVEKCRIMYHNVQHLGKPFRCDFKP